MTELMHKIAKYGHPVWTALEKRLAAAETGQTFPPPVFIIGAPRSGSTILYQALTNYLKVAYADNLCRAFYRDFSLGFRLSRLLYGDAAHNCYRSRFGDTRACGGHAPCECGPFWRRFLPDDHHYIPAREVDRYLKSGLKEAMEALFRQTPYPFIIKNLVLSMRLHLVHRFWPEARLIWVRREPENIVHSIMKARHSLRVPPHQWWSVKPAQYKQWLDRPEMEMVCHQVWAMEEHMEEDLRLFPETRQKVVWYGDFLDNVENTVDELGSFIGQPERRAAYRPFEKRKTTPTDTTAIQQTIRRLYP
ncbi:MAG: sulfotransferase [Calditrichaeota bacterium]|nr:MAG: sulfotransferase [Calditrichota bacterium]